MNNWKIVKLNEIIDFNPKEFIKKGTLAKKIAMEQLEPFFRDILRYEIIEFTGGTKFRNGDTLMARITPCLENGKTAQMNILNENEVGFGSTEYIICRAKKCISDQNYIYYLMLSPLIRDIAIKSMVGSSGRQRVQLDVVKNIELAIPTLEEQIEIGKMLKIIDDKIENNRMINHHLEQMAETIFKSYFIDFEPFNGEIPDDWKECLFFDMVSVAYGKTLPTKKLLKSGYRVFGGNGQIGYYSEYLYSKEKILISCRGAASGAVKLSRPYSFVTNNSLVITEKSPSYYAYLKQLCLYRQFFDTVTGSAQPQVTIDSLKLISLIHPNEDTLIDFSNLLQPIYEKIEKNTEESEKLALVRDVLLPKLMLGKILTSPVTK